MAVEAVRRGVNDDLNVSEVLDLLNSDIQVVINTTENGSKILNACGGEVYVCHRKPGMTYSETSVVFRSGACEATKNCSRI